MPGILPMKMIQVGSASQARVAQACDRCRSKKIRCDGKRPSCTQCLNVGFECKTSDKLSRRAFPRGYTESLEERVRALESELRDFKDLLDEKDEKLDMLSKISSRSPQPVHKRPLSARSPLDSIETRREAGEPDEYFTLEVSPVLSNDSHLNLTSSLSRGNSLIDAFKMQANSSGRITENIDSTLFFHPRHLNSSHAYIAPSRMLSDQLVNIFFQEWGSLYPVLHRPTFLSLYSSYIAEQGGMEGPVPNAQLNLVFGIAALSSQLCNEQQIASFESQWMQSMRSIVMGNSIPDLQCIVLATIYSLMRGDGDSVLAYKSVAVGLASRLRLQMSQKHFDFTPLALETRKKVFWTLYTVDAFSAAHLGQSMSLRDDEIACEFPVDADDEYVTDSGFLPALPGESTKLSSALALFRLSRVLSSVLSQIYPSRASHKVSFRILGELSDELEHWNTNLSPHLRLQFAQGKLSTNTISSRSPILSLAYYYVRSLIQRPAILANSGDLASSSVLALADSSKHISQIAMLLTERGTGFSFCIGKQDLLTLAGFGLLFQTFEAGSETKLVQDCQKSILTVVGMLASESSPCAAALGRITSFLFTQPHQSAPTQKAHNRSGGVQNRSATYKKRLSINPKHTSSSRISKSPRSPMRGNNTSAVSLTSIKSEPVSSADSASSNPTQWSSPDSQASQLSGSTLDNGDINYLTTNPDQLTQLYRLQNSSAGQKQELQLTREDWERLLSNIDQGQPNLFESIYPSQSMSAPMNYVGSPQSSSSHTTQVSDSALAWPNTEQWTATGHDTIALPSDQSQIVASFKNENVISPSFDEYRVPAFPPLMSSNDQSHQLQGNSSPQFMDGRFDAIMMPHSSPQRNGFTQPMHDGFGF